MGWEQLPPEIPVWRQEFNACANCERLETELQDIKDSYNKVMEEKCPTDEVHCTCVPALRASRTKLEAKVEALEASRDDWHKIADSRSSEIIRLEAENTRLQLALKEISTWSEEMNNKALSDIKVSMFLWRGCVATAREALEKK